MSLILRRRFLLALSGSHATAMATQVLQQSLVGGEWRLSLFSALVTNITAWGGIYHLLCANYANNLM